MTIGPPTAAALDITAAAGQDIEVNLGDNGAANKLSILDSLGVEVASINSDGRAQFDSTVQVLNVDVNTGGVPLQAEMVAAFGAGVAGQIGVITDTGGAGVVYLCVFSGAAGGAVGWHHAVTVVGA
jgi:hypothetical protein